jgi:hypothetical protein
MKRSNALHLAGMSGMTGRPGMQIVPSIMTPSIMHHAMPVAGSRMLPMMHHSQMPDMYGDYAMHEAPVLDCEYDDDAEMSGSARKSLGDAHSTHKSSKADSSDDERSGKKKNTRRKRRARPIGHQVARVLIRRSTTRNRIAKVEECQAESNAVLAPKRKESIVPPAAVAAPAVIPQRSK